MELDWFLSLISITRHSIKLPGTNTTGSSPTPYKSRCQLRLLSYLNLCKYCNPTVYTVLHQCPSFPSINIKSMQLLKGHTPGVGLGDWGQSWGQVLWISEHVLFSSSGFSYKQNVHHTDRFTIMNGHEVVLKAPEIVIPTQIDRTEGQTDRRTDRCQATRVTAMTLLDHPWQMCQLVFRKFICWNNRRMLL